MSLSAFLFIGIIAFSQAPVIQKEKSYGGKQEDVGYTIRQTKDKGFIIGATTSSKSAPGYHDLTDYMLMKMDKGGNLVWQKAFGGSGTDVLTDVRQTKDKGYIMVGYSNSADGDVTNVHSSTDVWVVKTDIDGNIQWQKCFGGTATDMGASVSVTDDDDIVVCASASSTDGDVTNNKGGSDVWLLNLNRKGKLQFQKTYGGSGNDYGKSAVLHADGTMVIAASVESSNGDITGAHGASDTWVFKLDAIGNIVFQKALGGTFNDYANKIDTAIGGGYIVAGSTASNDGDVSGNHGIAGTQEDGWIYKLDASGVKQWQLCLGGTDDEQLYSVVQDKDSGYVICGATASNDGDVTNNHRKFDVWIIKLTKTGTLLWQSCYGGTDRDEGRGIMTTKNTGEYFAIGYNASVDGDCTENGGKTDVWLLRLVSGGGKPGNLTAKKAPVYVNDLNILISPNPVKDMMSITFNADKNVQYHFALTDMNGKVIKTERLQSTVGSNTFSFNISNLLKGIYHVQLTEAGAKKIVTKIVKE